MNERQLKLLINNQEKQIQDLYVIIDTLQANLRSAVSYLNEKQIQEISTQSFNWVMNWRAGDEKI